MGQDRGCAAAPSLLISLITAFTGVWNNLCNYVQF